MPVLFNPLFPNQEEEVARPKPFAPEPVPATVQEPVPLEPQQQAQPQPFVPSAYGPESLINPTEVPRTEMTPAQELARRQTQKPFSPMDSLYNQNEFNPVASTWERGGLRQQLQEDALYNYSKSLNVSDPAERTLLRMDAKDKMAQAQSKYPQNIARIEDAQSFQDVFDWALEGTSQVATTALNTIGAGLKAAPIGAAAGSLIPGVGTLTGAGVGMATGAGAYGTALETGDIAAELDRQGINIDDPTIRRYIQGGGSLAGALELAGFGGMAKAATAPLAKTLKEGVKTGIKNTLKAGLAAAPAGMAWEGATEGVQEMINIGTQRLVKKDGSAISRDEMSQVLNSTLLGTIGGGAMTTAGASVSQGITTIPDLISINGREKVMKSLADLYKQDFGTEYVERVANSMGYNSFEEALNSPEFLEAFDMNNRGFVDESYEGLSVIETDLVGNRPVFFNNAAGRPWASVDLTKAIHPELQNVEDGAVKELNKRNENFSISSYLDAVKQEAMDQLNASPGSQSYYDFLSQKVAKLTEGNDKLKALSETMSDEKFLGMFNVLKEDKLSQNVSDLTGFKQTDIKGFGNTAEQRRSTAILRDPGYKGNPRFGEIMIEINGEQKAISLPNVIKAIFRNNIDELISDGSTNRVAEALRMGLSSLYNIEGAQSIIADILSPQTGRFSNNRQAMETVAFVSKDGRFFSLAELLASPEQRHRVRLEATDTLVKSAQAKIENNPQTIASNEERLNNVRFDLGSLRKQAENIAADAARFTSPAMKKAQEARLAPIQARINKLETVEAAIAAENKALARETAQLEQRLPRLERDLEAAQRDFQTAEADIAAGIAPVEQDFEVDPYEMDQYEGQENNAEVKPVKMKPIKRSADNETGGFYDIPDVGPETRVSEEDTTEAPRYQAVLGSLQYIDSFKQKLQGLSDAFYEQINIQRYGETYRALTTKLEEVQAKITKAEAVVADYHKKRQETLDFWLAKSNENETFSEKGVTLETINDPNFVNMFQTDNNIAKARKALNDLLLKFKGAHPRHKENMIQLAAERKALETQIEDLKKTKWMNKDEKLAEKKGQADQARTEARQKYNEESGNLRDAFTKALTSAKDSISDATLNRSLGSILGQLTKVGEGDTLNALEQKLTVMKRLRSRIEKAKNDYTVEIIRDLNIKDKEGNNVSVEQWKKGTRSYKDAAGNNIIRDILIYAGEDVIPVEQRRILENPHLANAEGQLNNLIALTEATIAAYNRTGEETGATPTSIKEMYRLFYQVKYQFEQTTGIVLPANFKVDPLNIQKMIVRIEDALKAQAREFSDALHSAYNYGTAVPQNIYWGTREHQSLSNLAPRPFTFQGMNFKSVEHAYQTLKSGQVDMEVYNNEGWSRPGAKISGKLKVDRNISDQLMEDLIRSSLQQNPKHKQMLLATKNAPLTHKQDGGHWGTKFPEIMMRLRDEFRGVKQELPLQTEPSTITFEEDQSSGYAQRTRTNAAADATIAIAANFESAGEKLTKSSVEQQGKLYLPIDVKEGLKVTPAMVMKIVEQLNMAGAKSLNIAGNGIYTFRGMYSQTQLDQFVLDLLTAINKHPNLQQPIESIRSGGQTGIDEAGAKAGSRLGIETTVLAPKGWKQRGVDGQDVTGEAAFKQRFNDKRKLSPTAIPFTEEQLNNDKFWQSHWGMSKLEDSFFEFVQKLGLPEPVFLLNPQEAIALLESMGDLTSVDQIANGLVDGKRIVYKDPTTGETRYYVYVDPRLTYAAKQDALAHELGHVVLDQFFTRLRGPQAEAIWAEYKDYRKNTSRYNDRGELEFKNLARLLQMRPEELMEFQARGYDIYGNIDLNSKEAAAYLEYVLDFHEWFADRVQARLRDATPPKSHFAKMIDGLLSKFMQLFDKKYVREGNVQDFVDALLERRPMEWSQPKNAVDVLRTWHQQNMKDYNPETDEFNPEDLKAVADFWTSLTGITLKGQDYDLFIAQMAQLNAEDRSGLLLREFMAYALNNPNQMLIPVAAVNVIKKLARNPDVRVEVIRKASAYDEFSKRLMTDDNYFVAYAYQLWATGALKLKAPAARTWFGKIKEWLKQTFDYMSNNEQADLIFAYIHSGKASLDERMPHLGGATNTVAREAFNSYIVPAWKKFYKSRFGGAVWSTAYTRMMNTDIPSLQKLALKLYVGIGQAYEGQSFIEAKEQMMYQFYNKFDQALSSYSENELRQIQTILNMGLTKWEVPAYHGDRIAKGVQAVRDIYAWLYDYAAGKGLEMGYIENYAPWVLDEKKMLENRDKFVELFSEPNLMAAIKQNDSNSDPVTFYKSIMKSLSALENPDGQISSVEPAVRADKERTLKWVQEVATPQQLERFVWFLSDNVVETAHNYAHSVIKAAEFQERFPKHPEKNTSMNTIIERYLMPAVKEGATNEDIRLARQAIEAVLGRHGGETNEGLHRMFDSEAPPGQVINPTLQKVQGGIMTAVNLALLGLSTITSLQDSMGTLLRTGSLDKSLKGFTDAFESLKLEKGGNRDTLMRLADIVGTSSRDASSEVLNQLYGGSYIDGAARKINEKFFSLIGLNIWTRFTRIAATRTGHDFIKSLATNVQDENSYRWLAELNLRPEDVKFKENGDLAIFEQEELDQFKQTAIEAHQKGMQDDPKAVYAREMLRAHELLAPAVARFVEQSVLKPNAMLRPIWGSNPHFMLIFHLKSFMYTFHEVIVKRMAMEAVKGNLGPAAVGLMMMPMLLVSDWLRERVQYGTDTPRWKANWGFFDHLSHSAERAGLYGVGQLGIDAVNDLKYGGWGYESFAGPTYDLMHADTLADWLPGRNIWKHWGD